MFFASQGKALRCGGIAEGPSMGLQMLKSKIDEKPQSDPAKPWHKSKVYTAASHFVFPEMCVFLIEILINSSKNAVQKIFVKCFYHNLQP